MGWVRVGLLELKKDIAERFGFVGGYWRLGSRLRGVRQRTWLGHEACTFIVA
jgi:hypothetical protein